MLVLGYAKAGEPILDYIMVASSLDQIRRTNSQILDSKLTDYIDAVHHQVL